MIAVHFLSVMALSLNVALAFEGDVRAVCGKTKTGVVDLKYRDRLKNIKIIKSWLKRNGTNSDSLKKMYSNDLPSDEAALQKLADVENRKNIPHSFLKEVSLKYSSEQSKLMDPEGYRDALLESVDKYVPAEFNKLKWFLNLKNKIVKKTEFRSPMPGEMPEFFGAVTQWYPIDNGLRIDIVFSNNASESIPFLLPTLIHELQHVQEYEEQWRLLNNKSGLQAHSIIGEARAYDVGMRAYVTLAKKNPEIFCDWLNVSWSAGELVVPLGWIMNSLERDLRDGRTILEYAKRANYSGGLLKNDGKSLREDIQSRISDLKLRYVK